MLKTLDPMIEYKRQPQPKVRSTRASNYVSHAMPETRGSTLNPLDPLDPLGPREMLELLNYSIDDAKSAHSVYIRIQDALTNGAALSSSLSTEKQRAAQKLNLAITMRLTDLAHFMGLTKEQFAARYMPKTQSGLWCCSPGSALRTPIDFLSQMRELIIQSLSEEISMPDDSVQTQAQTTPEAVKRVRRRSGMGPRKMRTSGG